MTEVAQDLAMAEREHTDPTASEQRNDPVTTANVDLSNCDRELIQFPGAIQPHGTLLALSEPELRVRQAAANAEAYFACPAASLLNRGLDSILGASTVALLRDKIRSTLSPTGSSHIMRIRLPGTDVDCEVFGNRIDGLLLLEFERIDPTAAPGCAEIFADLRTTMGALQRAESLSGFLGIAVDRIRELTGFDRVLAYRFAGDGSGEVVAESVDLPLESYLGLRYPASDIPAPSRRLFELSWVRHLPDVDYTPVPLIPAENPMSGQPLDLSYSLLRSVSVMYSGYLRNMGVKSTMVMTLLKDGRLWGLISCMHHESPRHVAYPARLAAESLAHIVSLLLSEKEKVEQLQYREQLSGAADHLFDAMRRARHYEDALFGSGLNLLTGIDATGAALISGGTVSLLGLTPPELDVEALGNWLAEQPDSVVATDALSTRYPAAAGYRDTASGLLAARLSRTKADFVMWFRPEEPTEVAWAGDPNKPVSMSDDGGEPRLLPRTSFAMWKETLRGRSRSWLGCELEHARHLRRTVIEVIVERADELARANQELQRSNLELDSFAYAASHDLKEPLRGIHNFACFLREDEGDALSAEGIRRVNTVIRLAQRMEELLESLLAYSRLGQIELDLQPNAIGDLIGEALESMSLRIQDSGAVLTVCEGMPVARCDRIRVVEIFHNLITNAIKYNNREDKRIEIGYRDSPEGPVYYVRDNGIGIAPNQQLRIFQLFRRLHGRDEYGGGAGAGLTIAKKAIERHGGRIWVESEPDEGSTFFFTLAPNGESEVGSR